MLNKYPFYRCLLTSACAATLIALTGCRSMPGRNLFAFRNGPSAETLAGNGPTTTYPSPPSASATPEAIASVAGGTTAPNTLPPKYAVPGGQPVTERATAQVAGIDIKPGYATPASSNSTTNMAAAEANGIYGSNPASGSNGAVAAASGYTFGSKALTAKADRAEATNPSSVPASDPSAYAKNSAYAPLTGGIATPSTSYTPPPTVDDPTAGGNATLAKTAPQPDATAGNPSAGYTLPADFPVATSKTSNSPAEVAPADQQNSNAFAPPAAVSPDFSTASTAASLTAPSAAVATPKSSTSSGGYMPGSTATSHGYPTGDIEPTTSGSFYR